MEGKNVVASTTGNVPVIEEGEKGAKGATERPRSWEEISDGSTIESGTGNEQWIDIVLYGDDFYQCIRSFTKGNGVVPTNTIYFKVITDYKRLATGLFLAKKGYIKNLMVNDIFITDDGTETGKVLLKADKDGIKCNTGTFKNVILVGSLRNPFLNITDSFTNPYRDNIVMQNQGAGWGTAYNLPWNVEQSGRKICLVSNLWNRVQVSDNGASVIEVPKDEQKYGCRFYENGIAKTELYFNTEVLELLAYGDVSAKTDDDPKSKYIYGWIVLNRIDLMPSYKNGRQKRILAYGKVTGTTGGVVIKYKTFDGSKMSVSRGDKGINILHIPRWVDSESDLFVTLTNTSSYVSLGSIKATSDGFDINVLARGTNSFEEGSFNFEISNYNEFV